MSKQSFDSLPMDLWMILFKASEILSLSRTSHHNVSLIIFARRLVDHENTPEHTGWDQRHIAEHLFSKLFLKRTYKNEIIMKLPTHPL